MASRISGPKILLLQCSIIYQRVEGKLLSLEPVIMQVSKLHFFFKVQHYFNASYFNYIFVLYRNTITSETLLAVSYQ